MSQMLRPMRTIEPDDVERQMARMRGIYHAMNLRERQNPDLLDAGSLRRVADGAGVDVREVDQFIRQFEHTRRMMQRFFPPTTP